MAGPLDCEVCFGSPAGKEVENVLHLGHDLQIDLNSGVSCICSEGATVVKKRFEAPDLDHDRR